MILYRNLPEPMTALTRYSDTEVICLQELREHALCTHSPSYYDTQSPRRALQGELMSLTVRTETGHSPAMWDTLCSVLQTAPPPETLRLPGRWRRCLKLSIVLSTMLERCTAGYGGDPSPSLEGGDP